MNRTIRSSARAVVYKVFLRCLAENEAGQLLSELGDVYRRTADLTGIYPYKISFMSQNICVILFFIQNGSESPITMGINRFFQVTFLRLCLQNLHDAYTRIEND